MIFIVKPHGSHVLGEIGQCNCIFCPDGAIIQYKYPNRVYFNFKTTLCPIVPGRQGNYIFRLEKVFEKKT